MEALYIKYANLQKFLATYRRYTVHEPFLKKAEFGEAIQSLSYVKHTATAPDGVPYIVLLFRDESKYIKSSKVLRSFLQNIKVGPKHEIIVIVSKPLSAHIRNNVLAKSKTQIHVYLHRLFIIELPKGPLCSPHTILTPAERDYLCNHDIWHHPEYLPIMSTDDPQAIWLGAKPGDVIKIESFSDITGRSIRYRYVEKKEVVGVMKPATHGSDEEYSDYEDEDVEEPVDPDVLDNVPEDGEAPEDSHDADEDAKEGGFDDIASLVNAEDIEFEDVDFDGDIAEDDIEDPAEDEVEGIAKDEAAAEDEAADEDADEDADGDEVEDTAEDEDDIDDM
jgi:DNA-directed RNA polymerase subunit H (RpoH/RPB5)